MNTPFFVTNIYDPQPTTDQFKLEGPVGELLHEYSETDFNQASAEWQERQVPPKMRLSTESSDDLIRYSKASKHFNKNRLKYKGFKLKSGWYTNGHVKIRPTGTDRDFEVFMNHRHAFYFGELNCEMLELICSANGATLEKTGEDSV